MKLEKDEIELELQLNIKKGFMTVRVTSGKDSYFLQPYWDYELENEYPVTKNKMVKMSDGLYSYSIVLNKSPMKI